MTAPERKPYDSSRIANFGRDATRAYNAFGKARERLVKEINSALISGISPTKINHDLMGRCGNRKEMEDLMTVLYALVDVGDIPEIMIEPFKAGIRPRRV